MVRTFSCVLGLVLALNGRESGSSTGRGLSHLGNVHDASSGLCYHLGSHFYRFLVRIVRFVDG